MIYLKKIVNNFYRRSKILFNLMKLAQNRRILDLNKRNIDPFKLEDIEMTPPSPLEGIEITKDKTITSPLEGEEITTDKTIEVLQSLINEANCSDPDFNQKLNAIITVYKKAITDHELMSLTMEFINSFIDNYLPNYDIDETYKTSIEDILEEMYDNVKDIFDNLSEEEQQEDANNDESDKAQILNQMASQIDLSTAGSTQETQNQKNTSITTRNTLEDWSKRYSDEIERLKNQLMSRKDSERIRVTKLKLIKVLEQMIENWNAQQEYIQNVGITKDPTLNIKGYNFANKAEKELMEKKVKELNKQKSEIKDPIWKNLLINGQELQKQKTSLLISLWDDIKSQKIEEINSNLENINTSNISQELKTKIRLLNQEKLLFESLKNRQDVGRRKINIIRKNIINFLKEKVRNFKGILSSDEERNISSQEAQISALSAEIIPSQKYQADAQQKDVQKRKDDKLFELKQLLEDSIASALRNTKVSVKNKLAKEGFKADAIDSFRDHITQIKIQAINKAASENDTKLISILKGELVIELKKKVSKAYTDASVVLDEHPQIIEMKYNLNQFYKFRDDLEDYLEDSTERQLSDLIDQGADLYKFNGEKPYKTPVERVSHIVKYLQSDEAKEYLANRIAMFNKFIKHANDELIKITNDMDFGTKVYFSIVNELLLAMDK